MLSIPHATCPPCQPAGRRPEPPPLLRLRQGYLTLECPKISPSTVRLWPRDLAPPWQPAPPAPGRGGGARWHEYAGRDRVRGRNFIWYLFSFLFSCPGSMQFILARATNPDEPPFDLRIYPSVAVFCCCGGAVAARRRPQPWRPRVRGSGFQSCHQRTPSVHGAQEAVTLRAGAVRELERVDDDCSGGPDGRVGQPSSHIQTA